MTAAEVVDLSFSLAGRAVADDHADLLWQALRARLPWLEEDVLAGVHPLAGTSPGRDGDLYLSRRSRLTLRLSAGRVAAAQALCGAQLALGGSPVAVGAATVKPLWAAAVVYSSFVQVGPTDETAFLAECRRLLDALGVEGRLVPGKARRMRADGRCMEGFSLMLHGLGEEQSLRLQHQGLGAERKRGCGVFVPHKAIAAVGA